ncbi:MAG TPA: VOC family protein [Candidatus Binataceae bacterium]|jgi:catechol 2,3-dioxygenase-like lactoylglutathione lyase family enzyme|nr:VOC family protein [Candidatus Binataceae bacterium]
MFKIGKIFHLTHVVKDLAACDRWFDEIFAVNRFYHGFEKLAAREASLVLIGDLVMEPVMLAKVPDAERTPIGKFLTRFGEHFHSIAWYVDDVGAMGTDLTAKNLRLYDVTGRMVKPPLRAEAIWTHPKETHALLEFAAAGNYIKDPRLQPGWTTAPWREHHPLSIDRTSHITALFGDLKAAKALYVDLLGGKLLHEAETPGRKRSAFIAVGEDTVVEAAQPLSPTSPEGRDLELNGEGVHAVTFKTLNLKRATEFLKSKGQRIEAENANEVVLNTNDTFGMVVGFTDRSIPNDPR